MISECWGSWGYGSLRQPICLLVFVADGDGKCELVVGYTDRVVRAFRWEDFLENSDHVSGQLVLLKKWLLEGQVREQDIQSGTCHTVFKRWLPKGRSTKSQSYE